MNKAVDSIDLIAWTYKQKKPTVVSTSFGEYSAVLLHMVKRVNMHAVILWIDTQYNTISTIRYKEKVCRELHLNVVSYRGDAWAKAIPEFGTEDHGIFTDQIKIAPFRNALNKISPTYWISGIRREETEHRKNANRFEINGSIIKISPLLEWTKDDLREYIERFNLPNESNYRDPTKKDSSTECGLHTTYFK